jgi:hypothetical protein
MSDQLTTTETQAAPTPSLEQQMMTEALKQHGLIPEQQQAPPAPTVEQPTTPTVETPAAVEQPAAAPQAEPQIDYTAFIEKEFGTKDVQTIKERFTAFEQLQNELNQIKSQPKYKTSVAETLDSLLEGVSAAEQPKVLGKIAEFMALDETQLQPKELVSFDLKLKYPSLSDTQIEALINKRYGLSELATDDERLAGEAQLTIDSLEAKKNILDLKTKTLSTNPAKAQADLASIDREKTVAKYNQLTNDSLKNFKTISLKTDKVDVADFVVDTKAVEQIKADVAAAMINGGFEPNEQNVHEIAAALYKVNNFQHIINHVATQLQSNQIKKEVQDYHNADPKGGAVTQQKPLTAQEIEVKIAQQMGIL